MTSTATHSFRVVTLNVARGLRLRDHALSAWQHREKIDVLCLTETGRAAPLELRDDRTFIAECSLDPDRQGCAVMVAKWLPKPELVEATPNGAYVAVAIPLGRHKLTVVLAYAPCTPRTRQALAKSF